MILIEEGLFGGVAFRSGEESYAERGGIKRRRTVRAKSSGHVFVQGVRKILQSILDGGRATKGHWRRVIGPKERTWLKFGKNWLNEKKQSYTVQIIDIKKHDGCSDVKCIKKKAQTHRLL